MRHECVTQIQGSSGLFGNLGFVSNRHINKVCLPVRSSVGQEPRTQARQVYSSNTNSFSLQGVQVQQQLTSPLRITWRHTHTHTWQYKRVEVSKLQWHFSVANLTLGLQGKKMRISASGDQKKKKRKMYRMSLSLIILKNSYFCISSPSVSLLL